MSKHAAKKDNMSLEEFKEMCKELLPIIKIFTEHMERAGLTDNLATLTLSADGYVCFSVHNEPWNMIRLNPEEPATIRNEYVDVIKI